MQARRQEMKWGCFFVKKSKKWGVFCKKVENGGCFVKSGKYGVFFVKSGPFVNAGCIMYSISIFLFYILLIWGCVRTQRTPPCPRACYVSI